MTRTLTALTTLALALPAGAEPSASPPNVILVMCDDLGWGDTGFNGNKVIKTPHLDAMAAAGLKFNRFYAAAPVCSPTRGSAVTGRHPFRYGIYSANTGHMKEGELTLAELLKTKGYRTGHFGKWHMGTLTKTVKDANRGGPGGAKHYSPPQDNGFDVCFSTESKVPTWDPMWVPKKFGEGESRRNWWTPLEDTSQMQHYGTRYWDEKGNEVTENLRGDNSRVIMDRAAPFIEDAAKAGEPFFAVVWFHTPHLPVVAGPEHVAMYKKFGGHKMHYYGCITAMDEQVGRLRETLKKAGVADNTMLWFCSDNGPEGSDKAPGKTGGFRGRKRSLYEGGVRVPGLLEWPAVVKAGGVTEFPASTVDYLPTVLGALGMEMPDERPTDGIDLGQAIRGKVEEREKGLGFQSAGMATFVTHRYKLVTTKKKPDKKAVSQLQGAGGEAKAELYDLIADPYETKDISADHTDVMLRLWRELKAWQASCAKSDGGEDYGQRGPEGAGVLRFGAIADCQFANIPTRGARHYKLSKEKLAEAVDDLNTRELDFVIHLGDFIERDWVSFDVVGRIYRKLKAPGYHLLGNHDFSVEDGEKAKVAGELGMPARYYDFAVKGWRFIVLDGNELSTYAHRKGSPKDLVSAAYLKRLKEKRPTYCGGMGEDQIKWMKSKIEAARDAGERVILFNHFPVFPISKSHNLWNDRELLDALKPYAGTVVAWINGHNHAGGYGERDGIHYLTLHGMLDTKSNAYATIEIRDGALHVDGVGRQPDRVLKFEPKASK